MKEQKTTLHRPRFRCARNLLACAVLVTATAGMSGCHNGTLFGAGVGALLGQAIGGNTESTVAGAIYGGLIGGAVEASHSTHRVQSAGYYTYYPSYPQQQHHHQYARHSHCYDY
ncbi:MAG: glycine zipper 2TM domain-containing protein [Planctomycetota bacterium]|jgi:uncharacterized protein YcfJ